VVDLHGRHIVTRIVIRTIEGMYIDSIVEVAEDGEVVVEHHEEHFCKDAGKPCCYCSRDYDLPSRDGF
jgi:hypothetical protein